LVVAKLNLTRGAKGVDLLGQNCHN